MDFFCCILFYRLSIFCLICFVHDPQLVHSDRTFEPSSVNYTLTNIFRITVSQLKEILKPHLFNYTVTQKK